MESPDIRFYDEGRAKLTNGIANISLDPIFIEAIEQDIGYNIYLSPEGKTRGIYVAEKANDYFIVKSYVQDSNIAFSWLISAIRKGYKDIRLDLERKEDLEINAVIDGENKLTDIEISGEGNATSSVQNNAKLPNSVTGNAINEAGLETDLSSILEPQTNTTSVVVENNSNASDNATTSQINQTIQQQKEKTNEASENKFTISSIDENEIIKQIGQRTKLSEEKIKQAIKFRRKELAVAGSEKDTGEGTAATVIQQVQPFTRIQEINGSVIIRLG